MDPALAQAREMLLGVTPLRADCGRQCGAACCLPDEDGKGGMLLFPGEEECYDPLPEGFRTDDTDGGLLLTCSGVCDRSTRPLSCRIFPLWIFPEADGSFRVKMDPRGRAVCPLTGYGLKALDPEFVSAVRAAGEKLMSSSIQRQFLERTALSIRKMLEWQEE